MKIFEGSLKFSEIRSVPNIKFPTFLESRTPPFNRFANIRNVLEIGRNRPIQTVLTDLRRYEGFLSKFIDEIFQFLTNNFSQEILIRLQNTLSSSKRSPIIFPSCLTLFFLPLFSIRFAINPTKQRKTPLVIDWAFRKRLNTRIRGHRWRNRSKNLFHFVSIPLLRSSTPQRGLTFWFKRCHLGIFIFPWSGRGAYRVCRL